MGQKEFKAKEKVLFEKWAVSEGYDIEWLDLVGQYDTRETQDAWGAWLGRAQLAAPVAAQEPVDALSALRGLLSRYVGLVESGDAGNWDAEKEPEVIAARAVLASQPAQGERQP